MEHQLVAPRSDRAHQRQLGTGDLVKADQVLATIHPHEPSKAEDTVEESVIAMGAAEYPTLSAPEPSTASALPTKESPHARF